MDLKKLTKVISCQWRVQSFSKNKPQAQLVAYIDARDAMKLLDEAVGPENWQDDYKMVGDTRFAGVGIKVDGEWVWKWDTGTETQVEADKGEVSDSFKRACVKWGIGRFLYDLDIRYLPANEAKTSSNNPYVVDTNGKRVFDITKHVNSLK